MTDVLMPRLSDSMQEGTILTWLAADGDDVVEGQELVEVETDKATMTHISESSGVLSIVIAEGTTVTVGDVIARVKPAATGVAPETEPATAASEPRAARLEENAPIDAASLQPATNGNGADVAATPMARRIARVHGVDLGSLTGSGPRGRVLRADVLAAAGLTEPAPTSAPTTAGQVRIAAGGRGGSERVRLTRLQQVVARRMAEAKATVPEFQVQTEVEMTAAVAFRTELKQLAEARGSEAPSLNDLIVKAAAICLRRFPRANGSYVDGAFELHERVNVAVAVAAEDALVVPVIDDADRKPLGAIAADSRRLAAAVRDGSITPPHLSGATFTVSNLGMYGMTAITPVINPPQAAILGVGAIRDALARAPDGSLVDRRLLTLTLTCDHRILYGADAAQFLAAIREVLEHPAALAL